MTKFNRNQWMNHLDRLPEDARLTRSSMTEMDHKLASIWKCAFPNGLKHDDVLQLIYRMYVVDGDEHPMSFRAVAHNVGVLLGINYIYVLNEVYGVNEIKPDQSVQAWLKDRLQTCGYYDWLAYDDYPEITADTIAELIPILVEKRPCKRITLRRQAIPEYVGKSDSETINNFLRSELSLPASWQGIEWREYNNNMTMWDEVMRALQYNADRSEQYMKSTEAHVLVGKITWMLDDHERMTRAFTNHRANGIWHPVTDSHWQYWMISFNSTDIGVFGIEEEQ